MSDSDDPFLRPDVTKARPRPGAGRPPYVDAVRPKAASMPFADTVAISPSARALFGLGLNPLVRAATPLLILTANIRESTSSVDVAGLRRHVLDEIRQFEEQASSARVPNE